MSQNERHCEWVPLYKLSDSQRSVPTKFSQRSRLGRSPLVLPVARLPLGHPLDRLGDAFVAGGVRLGVDDPLDVLALVARAELLVGDGRLLVLLDRGHEIG